MTLSDIAIKRPVLAAVLSLLIIAFGAIGFSGLSLRELPDVDRPVVSVDVGYRGASAQVVETQVTRVIEDQLSGIEGIELITATSRDGRASINIEFKLSRDLDGAANDVQAAVQRARSRLPADIDDPSIQKSDADSDPIIWFNLQSTTLDQIALTDFAERNIVDQLSTVDGVANVRVGGGQRRALRIWLDTDALTARGLTADDVEQALRAENIELPAGSVEGRERDWSLRIARPFSTPEEFARIAVRPRGDPNAATVRLGDVARIETAPEEVRRLFRGNGVEQVGLGIVRQSKSNALQVGQGVKAEVERLKSILPPGTDIVIAYDSTVFIATAIERVWHTLGESVLLVVLVIFLFLGSLRAALVPAAVIPVCLIGAFGVMALFGLSINLLTLLALVLAIGLVVDDSIIVLENAQRRMDTYGEPPTVAALRGSRQVFFAVIATSAVLIAVFTPIFFMGGYTGRLFVELAITITGVIAISAFAALTLSPMMCSKLLRPVAQSSPFNRAVEGALTAVRASYRASLEGALRFKLVVLVLFVLVVGGGGYLLSRLSSELTPPEDRGNLLVQISAPEGAGFDYTSRVVGEVESVLMSYVDSGEAQRVLVVSPGFQDTGTNRFNSGFGRVFLTHWDERGRDGAEIVGEINQRVGEIPGAVVRARMQDPFQAPGGGGGGEGVSIVLGGQDYAQLSGIADRVVGRLRQAPTFIRPRHNYEPNSPRVIVTIDRERAAVLGVSVASIGRALESTMGARRVNTVPDRGREYYVFLQAERDARSEIADLNTKYVRSSRTGELIPLSSVAAYQAIGDSAERRRVNRLAAVTVGASLPPGVAIGDAIAELERITREEIGAENVSIDYTGAARQFKQSSSEVVFAFGLALLIVFLVLAAQFESFIHPFVIMLTVPLAIAGGLFGLFTFGQTLNIYSQIGLIILIALAAKNGILIVEFANQLREEGGSVRAAILEASDLRIRPVLMTSIATVVGAVPLILMDGAGAESRETIGVVIVFGVTVATLLTLFVVPVFYDLLARFTRAPDAVARDIERYESEERANPVTTAAE